MTPPPTPPDPPRHFGEVFHFSRSGAAMPHAVWHSACNATFRDSITGSLAFRNGASMLGGCIVAVQRAGGETGSLGAFSRGWVPVSPHSFLAPLFPFRLSDSPAV